MEQLARTFIFLGMLFVNLITTHRCSRRKYSLTLVIKGLTLFTALVFLVAFLIRFLLKTSYVNEYIIIILGFSYIFPLKYLYDETLNRIFAIMFFSWTHTITVTSISIQIAKLFGFTNYFSMALLIQTTIYLFSTPLIIKFVKSRFIFILKNIPEQMNKTLIVLGLIQYTAIIMIHLYTKVNTGSYWGIIMVTLVALTATISYHLIYIVVKNFKSINYFKQLAYSDSLTGIKNRLALILDCEQLISQNKRFTFIYMDLNNFKKVNDTYGHSVGDEYLKQFTKTTIETIGDKGSLYRMSGDEFICIYYEDKIGYFLSTFNEKISRLFDMNISFLGVSIGYAKFPEDADSLDKLIKKADKIMYQAKP